MPPRLRPEAFLGRKQARRQIGGLFSFNAVIDVKRGVAITDRAVTIRDARIVKVEPAHGFTSRRDFRVVDGTGKFLIPGLWDMHVHIYNNGSQGPPSIWFLPVFVAVGVTGIREMWTNPDQLPQINGWRKDVANGKLIAPRIGAAGTLVDGTDLIWPKAPLAHNQAEARAFVKMEKDDGFDFVKVYTNLSREAYFALIFWRAVPSCGVKPQREARGAFDFRRT